jgi:hypothetical protein
MATKKIKVLADCLRVHNKVNEYRQPVIEFGYVDYTNGDVVEVPDWIADKALSTGINSPNGAYRPAAIPVGDDEDDHVLKGTRDDVSPSPEHDFGSTDVGGNLLADPKGELAGQRAEARKAEAKPVVRQPHPQARKS